MSTTVAWVRCGVLNYRTEFHETEECNRQIQFFRQMVKEEELPETIEARIVRIVDGHITLFSPVEKTYQYVDEEDCKKTYHYLDKEEGYLRVPGSMIFYDQQTPQKRALNLKRKDLGDVRRLASMPILKQNEFLGWEKTVTCTSVHSSVEVSSLFFYRN